MCSRDNSNDHDRTISRWKGLERERARDKEQESEVGGRKKLSVAEDSMY